MRLNTIKDNSIEDRKVSNLKSLTSPYDSLPFITFSQHLLQWTQWAKCCKKFTEIFWNKLNELNATITSKNEFSLAVNSTKSISQSLSVHPHQRVPSITPSTARSSRSCSWGRARTTPSVSRYKDSQGTPAGSHLLTSPWGWRWNTAAGAACVAWGKGGKKGIRRYIAWQLLWMMTGRVRTWRKWWEWEPGGGRIKVISNSGWVSTSFR